MEILREFKTLRNSHLEFCPAPSSGKQKVGLITARGYLTPLKDARMIDLTEVPDADLAREWIVAKP